MSKFTPIIGLEIHVELKTKTKMFCYSLNDPDEKHPNVNICPVCMGHPGTLPVINQAAVEKVIMTGLALNGEIAGFSQFDRKNYFYPDLPKGYQISQYQHPLVNGGFLDLPISNQGQAGGQISNFQFPISKQIQNFNEQSFVRRVRIRRIHLEEDTGRLIHKDGFSTSSRQPASLVDFNRAGVPLLELVTEPDLRSGEEVKKFGEDLRLILRYLEVSDADMEKGQLRIEVNISLRPETLSPKSEILNKSQIQNSNGQNLGTKVEIKNINSFKFAAEAADYEIARQTKLLERGEKVKAETRGWNEDKKETFSQRHKEEAYDYRYFPEPDLPPLKISDEYINNLRVQLPELPEAKRVRLAKEYGLEKEIAEILLRDKKLAAYFEEVVSELGAHLKEVGERPQKDLVKLTAAVMTVDLQNILKGASAKVADLGITPENLAELILYLGQAKISNLAFKKVLAEMFKSKEDPSDIIDRLGIWQISGKSDLEDMVSHIFKENPKAVEDFRAGKESSLQFLVGQVMKESRGKANPKIVQEIIKKILNSKS